MSEGRQAADETRAGIGNAFKATEDIRKNINSFADELIGGNKEHKSTGFSKDAKAVGNAANNSSNTTGSKVDESASQIKHANQ